LSPVRVVVVWLVEGTWQGCLDAAADIVPPDARVALLHVSPSDVSELATAATAGLLGRAFQGHKPSGSFEEVADNVASEILEAAAARLGREDTELLRRHGRVEREVLGAVARGSTSWLSPATAIARVSVLTASAT